jgi:predicted 2-oxoglutarate/Fe(II)-dependent dioxygenase YbiX
MAGSPQAAVGPGEGNNGFEGHQEVAQELGDVIISALQGSALFRAAARRCGCFRSSAATGAGPSAAAVDNAIRQITGRRSDPDRSFGDPLLGQPDDAGRELVVGDTYGVAQRRCPST